MKDMVLNTDHDLYWIPCGCLPKPVERVETLTITFRNDLVTALVVQRASDMDLVRHFQNGDSLVVVTNRCGQRNKPKFQQEDVYISLSRCSIKNKGLDSLFSMNPQDKRVVGAWMRIQGTLRFGSDEEEVQ